MKLKYQVCTAEQGLRFNEYGVKEKSYYLWYEGSDNAFHLVQRTLAEGVRGINETRPAYSCAEVGLFWEQAVRKLGLEKIHTLIQANSVKGQIPNRKSPAWETALAVDRPLAAERIVYSLGIFEFTVHWKAQAVLRLIKEGYIEPEELSLCID